MSDLFESFITKINLFDVFVLIIFIYCIVQCFVKGFSLSLISFMKWVISTVVTIILVPKLQPIVSEYIESEFINNVGLGIAIFIITLKGYVVTVCIFSILNWFYPLQNWGISAEDAISFDFINKGSEILIEEFPSSEDFIDTKEKIEKI